MKYVKQFLIISAICLIGELCRYILPFPIPSNIYGLILLLTGLLTGLIKLEQVDETATFLVDIMPIMFIPAGVGLLVSFDALKPNLAAIVIITLVTTVAVMGITGIAAQAVMKYTNRKEASGK